MALGDRVLTEKTRVVVTLFNFFLLLGSIISGVVMVTTWKADVENRLVNNENNIIEIEAKLNSIDNVQIELAEIKTDLKWIRAALEASYD